MSEKNWTAHFKAQAKSGQAIAEYCREQGLKVHQFHYWKSKARRAKGERSGFELLTPTGVLSLQRGSWRVELRAGFDAGLLRSVVRALESA